MRQSKCLQACTGLMLSRRVGAATSNSLQHLLRPRLRLPKQTLAWARAQSTASARSLVTEDDVARLLQHRGMSLSVRELGPFWRLVCRDGESDKVLAVTSGWIWPVVQIMHCETLQVFTRGMRGDEGDRIRGGALGLGLMIGCATFAYGVRKGCKKAEILAIKDDEHQHARLVKYYTYFGFKFVKTVGDNGLADLLDQVSWGGVGTRMDAEPEAMLVKWSPPLQRRLAEL